jgi:hypothetical protein
MKMVDIKKFLDGKIQAEKNIQKPILKPETTGCHSDMFDRLGK